MKAAYARERNRGRGREGEEKGEMEGQKNGEEGGSGGERMVKNRRRRRLQGKRDRMKISGNLIAECIGIKNVGFSCHKYLNSIQYLLTILS